jgi:hypothetical protein
VGGNLVGHLVTLEHVLERGDLDAEGFRRPMSAKISSWR